MKKLLAATLALAMFVGVAAPAYAWDGPPCWSPRRVIRVENHNWIGWEMEDVWADSYVGYELIEGNAGEVEVDNGDAYADAYLEIDKNSNETEIDCECLDGDIWPCVCDPDPIEEIEVINTNDVVEHQTYVSSYSDVGNGIIVGNAGDVEVDNGGATSISTAFVTINSNVTRIRRGTP